MLLGEMVPNLAETKRNLIKSYRNLIKSYIVACFICYSCEQVKHKQQKPADTRRRATLMLMRVWFSRPKSL
jgi:hypothetical protein